MLLHIALVAEILTVIICIYSIYGKRFKLDWKTLGVFFSILIVLEIINNNHLDGKYSILAYLLFFIYCIVEFRSSVRETLISIILCITIITAIQFICLLLSNLLAVDAEFFRNAVSNIMSLFFVSLLSLQTGLYELKKSICKNSKFMKILLGFICLIVMLIILQGKLCYEVHMQYFLLAIPAIIMLLYAIKKWYTAWSEAEEMRGMIFEIEENRENYENLLTKVRLRQHAFKNHMEAIAFLRYTYETDQKIGQIEEDYYNRLLKENKYNDLLLLENDVLAGYLYRKFQEAENDGIEIDFKIATEFSQCRVPIYHVIEMLGILFDNAMEAVKDTVRKEIYFSIDEADGKYVFLIRNPFLYVPYKDIEEWFRFEKSRKGNGRGLGLYHLKCLCKEWDSEIGCGNIEMEKENWIIFSLRMRKDG